MHYRTEIHIAPDRYVCLQLPDFIPAGRATVTVSVAVGADDAGTDPATETETEVEADRHADIEWWDEFDGADPRRD